MSMKTGYHIQTWTTRSSKGPSGAKRRAAILPRRAAHGAPEDGAEGRFQFITNRDG